MNHQLNAGGDAMMATGRSHIVQGLPDPDYDSHPLFQPSLKKIDDLVRAQALKRFLPALQERYVFHLSMPRTEYKARIGAGDETLRAMQKRGCALLALRAPDKARIQALVAADVERVTENVRRGDVRKLGDAQMMLDPVDHAAVFQAVHEALEAIDVFSVAQAYAGGPVILKTVAIQVNDAARTAEVYEAIDDRGLPRHSPAYFHIDSNVWPPVKALIYLNDGSLDEGPLRYVEGSHRWADEFEAMVRKTNDKLKLSDAQFLSLPAPFRRHAYFGDFLDPLSEGARRLLDNEVAVCDGGSDLALFDNSGVHRGGFVRRGRRQILQCSFSRPPGLD